MSFIDWLPPVFLGLRWDRHDKKFKILVHDEGPCKGSLVAFSNATEAVKAIDTGIIDGIAEYKLNQRGINKGIVKASRKE